MQIFINKNGQQLGPFEEEKVLEMLRNGQLLPNDFGIKQGQQSWQKLGEMFPQPIQSASIPPINKPNVQVNQHTPTPQKSGSSKGLMFGLIGCGGLILLSVVGLLAFFAFSNRSSNDVTVSKNTNSNTKTSPPVITDFKAMKDKADEFAKLSPPLKLDSKVKLKGKIAVVESGKNGASIYGFNTDFTKIDEYPGYGLKREMLAKTPDEVDSLIQIICTKGKIVGRYEGNIIGYGNNCKVSLIDYRNKVIFAQSSFANNKAEKSVSSVYDGGDYIMPMPTEAIRKYTEQFVPEKIEITANDASTLPSLEDTALFGRSAGEKLGQLNFPIKLDDNAKIKGKITLIQTSSSSSLIGIDLDGKINPPLPNSIILTKESVGFADARLATKTSEIDTLIQVNCKAGSVITKVKGIAVSSNVCTVNIVDYKAFAVVAQKTFVGKTINNNRYSDPSIYEDKKATVDFPRAEIEEYIKQFPKS